MKFNYDIQLYKQILQNKKNLKKVLTNAKKSDILVKLSMRQANKISWC